MRAKETLRATLRRAGWDLTRWPTRRRKLAEAFQHLARVGVNPATVVDVGVGYGTPELYAAFPSARLLLVEPVTEREPDLQNILQSRDGEYVLVAAGAQPGTVQLQVSAANTEWSTVYPDDSSPHQWDQRQVQLVTLDSLVSERSFDGPYLLKIDVQGAELEVLKGAKGLLRDTEAVALELSMFEFYRGAPLFGDAVRYMADQGFVAYDLTAGHERPYDGALAQVDVIFVPEHGALRQTARYES